MAARGEEPPPQQASLGQEELKEARDYGPNNMTTRDEGDGSSRQHKLTSGPNNISGRNQRGDNGCRKQQIQAKGVPMQQCRTTKRGEVHQEGSQGTTKKMEAQKEQQHQMGNWPL